MNLLLISFEHFSSRSAFCYKREKAALVLAPWRARLRAQVVDWQRGSRADTPRKLLSFRDPVFGFKEIKI
jgi:hypothetical protein